MVELEKIYTAEDVEAMRRQWEGVAFELKTKEVLGGILKRLDESNNYKATIGRDIIQIGSEIQQMKTDRQNEIDARKEHQQWHQSWWVRIGIVAAILFQSLNFLINTGVFS